MKIPDVFTFDKRIIDRIIKQNPEHRHKISEYSSKLVDNSDNIDILSINDLLPVKKEKKEK